MTFFAFGLNCESATLPAVEAFAVEASAQRALYEALDLGDEAEVMVLSTCNRTEVYLYGTEDEVRCARRALSARVGEPWPEEESFLLHDEAAVRHVLEVTSGLRSMVLGDRQILAQMKTAYRRAVDHGGVHSVLHRLMHTAFRTAKRVDSETEINRGAASVSTAALAMAREHFADRGAAPPLADLRILLVGTGKMGRLALNALDAEAPEAIRVTNRSPGKAQAVADEHDAEPIAWDRRHRAVETSDLVIVATGASEPVLRASALSPSSGGAERDTLLVDISMPRTVDPQVGTMEAYTLYDLDDLRAWTERVQAERREEIPRAEALCEEELEAFVTWVFHQEAMQPAIQALRDTFDAIREREVDRHAHRTDMNRGEVDKLTKSIMQKVLAVPIVKLKKVDPESIDFVQGIKLLHALFSRPSCEDESARDLQERTDSHVPSLSDAPSEFSLGSTDAPESGTETQIREALQLSKDESAP